MHNRLRFSARLTTTALAAAVLCAASTGAFAADSLTAQKFVTKAGGTNLMEIKLGHLAEQKSKTQAVDDFAQQMIDDHTKLQSQLKDAAQSENLNVPSDLPGKMQKKYNSMAKLSGSKFDKAYAQFNVKGHEQAVSLFKKEKKSENNAAISKLAANGLSTIESHYQMAQKLAKTVHASSM